MGNKRTRKQNKGKRRTRKYGGGENSLESSPSTKSDTSSKLSVSSRQYIGEPDDTKTENVGKSPNISSISSIENDDDTDKYISIDFGEPELRMRNGPCDKCYDRIRHILYKTKMPKSKHKQPSRDKLNQLIIRELKTQIPPYPIA
jgi:hypothetical protein